MLEIRKSEWLPRYQADGRRSDPAPTALVLERDLQEDWFKQAFNKRELKIENGS